MNSNTEYKVVLSDNSKTNSCKCINCYYDINSVYKTNSVSNKIKKEIVSSEFKQIIQENFSKGKYFS